MNVMSMNIWKSVLAIVLGLILVVWPYMAVTSAVVIIGIMLLIYGIVAFVLRSKRRSETEAARGISTDAIISLIIGLLLIIFPGFFAGILMIVLGIILIIIGIGQLTSLSRSKKNGYTVSGSRYIIPVLLLLAGIVMLFNPFGTARAVFIFFGIAMLVYGVFSLLGNRAIKDL